MTDETRRFADKFALRLPDGMRDQLRDAARQNNRSLNSEIVARLEASFEQEATGGRLVPANDLMKQVEKLSARLDEVESLSRVPDFLTPDFEKRLADLEAQVRKLKKPGS